MISSTASYQPLHRCLIRLGQLFTTAKMSCNNRSTEEHTTQEGCDQKPYCFTGMCHAIFKDTEWSRLWMCHAMFKDTDWSRLLACQFEDCKKNYTENFTPSSSAEVPLKIAAFPFCSSCRRARMRTPRSIPSSSVTEYFHYLLVHTLYCTTTDEIPPKFRLSSVK